MRMKNLKTHIMALNKEQCHTVKLKEEKSTVKVLDEFLSSKKEFLIFRDAFLKLSPQYCNSIALIVIPYDETLSTQGLCPTISELKKYSDRLLENIKCIQIKPLIECIEEDIYNKIKDNDPYDYIHVFDHPFVFEGRTTLKGPKTPFMIVGYIMNGFDYFDTH